MGQGPMNKEVEDGVEVEAIEILNTIVSKAVGFRTQMGMNPKIGKTDREKIERSILCTCVGTFMHTHNCVIVSKEGVRRRVPKSKPTRSKISFENHNFSISKSVDNGKQHRKRR